MKMMGCISIGRAVIKLLTANPAEIEEFVSAGGLDAIDRLLFRSNRASELPKFDELRTLDVCRRDDLK